MELQLDATITVLLISKISSILDINKTVIVASSWSSIFTLPTLMMHGQTQIKFDNAVWFGIFFRLVRPTSRNTEVFIVASLGD
jgi:hypothetical protein